MEQKEFEDIRSDDRIVKAIEGVSTLLTNMSGVDTAIQSAIDESNSTLKEIATDVSIISKAVTNSFTTLGTSLLPLTAMGSNDELTGVCKSILEVVTDINANIQNKSNAIDYKVTEADSTFISKALELAKFVCDDSNAKAYESNAKLFAEGTKTMMEPLKTLTTTYESMSDAARVLDGIQNLFSNVAKTVEGAGKSVALIVGSMIAMVTAISFMDWNLITKFIVAFPLLASSMAAGVYVISRASEKGNVEGIIQLAAGIGILSLSLLAFQFIEWETVAKGVIGLTALGTGLVLVVRMLPNKQIEAFTGSVLQLVGSMLILGVTTALLGKYADAMPWQDMLKGAGIMMIAGGVLWLASKLFVSGATDIGKSFAWISLGLVAFGVGLYAFQEIVEDIKWETWAYAGVTIAGLSAALWLVGKNPMTWSGVAGIVAMTAAIAVIPKALSMYDDVTVDQMGKAALCTTGLVTALSVVAAGGTNIVMAAASLLVAAGAVMLLAKSLQAYPMDLTYEQYTRMALGIGEIGGAFAVLGLTAGVIAIGAAQMLLVAGSVYAIAKAVRKAQEVDISKGINTAKQLVNWAKTTMSMLGELSIADIAKSSMALFPLNRLAATIGSLAIAVSSMASGTFDEFVIDEQGNRIVKATHRLKPADYAACGQNIANLLTALTEPLQKFGEGNVNLFGLNVIGNDVNAGIATLAKIDEVVDPMLNIAKHFDELNNTDYSAFGTAVTNLIQSTKPALESISRSNTGNAFLDWFSDSDYENGLDSLATIDSIVDPLLKVAKNFETLQHADYSAFGDSITNLIKATKPALESIARRNSDNAFIDWFSDSDYENGLNSLSAIKSIVEPLLEVAKNFDLLNNADYSAFGTSIAKLITTTKPAIESIARSNSGYMVVDWFSDSDYENGLESLSAIKSIVEPLLEVAKNFETLRKADYSAFGSSVTKLIKSTKPALESIARSNTGNAFLDWFSDSDYENGLDSLKAIGDIVGPMIDVANNFDKLTSIDYSTFGVSVTKLISSTKPALESLGSESYWYSSSDYEKGLESMSKLSSIVTPMCELSERFDTLVGVNYIEFGKAVDRLVNGIKPAMDKLGDEDGWFSDSNFKKGVKSMEGVGEIINPMVAIAQSAKSIKSTDYSVFGTKVTKFVNAFAPAMVAIAKNDAQMSIELLRGKVEDYISIANSLSGTVNSIKVFADVNGTTFTAFQANMTSMVNSIDAFKLADSSLPEHSRLAEQLNSVNRAFDDLDNENLQLVVESAKAIDRIANTDLSKLTKAKDTVAKELMKLLVQMEKHLSTIAKQAAKNDQAYHMYYTYDPNSPSGYKMEMSEHDTTEMTLNTIAMMLGDIRSKITLQQFSQPTSNFQF